MVRDKTCPICGMSLYQDGDVLRCENMACDYSIALTTDPITPTNDAKGKNKLWETIKTIWVMLGIAKWIVLGVIALFGTTIGLPAIFNSATLEPSDNPPGVVDSSPTSPITLLPPKINAPIQGTTNGIAWEYSGNVHDDRPHGNGIKELDNGSYFDGEWSHGQFLNGNGMEISEVGHFIGTFVNGFWSEGILQMRPSGAKYEGTFTHRNGLYHRHGQGRMEWPNGDWYEGGWQYDNRHGQGTAFHAATGSTQSGVWVDNVLQ
jgi:hypothetical protein